MGWIGGREEVDRVRLVNVQLNGWLCTCDFSLKVPVGSNKNQGCHKHTARCCFAHCILVCCITDDNYSSTLTFANTVRVRFGCPCWVEQKPSVNRRREWQTAQEIYHMRCLSISAEELHSRGVSCLVGVGW